LLALEWLMKIFDTGAPQCVWRRRLRFHQRGVARGFMHFACLCFATEKSFISIEKIPKSKRSTGTKRIYFDTPCICLDTRRWVDGSHLSYARNHPRSYYLW
jgi:hypothetical protein